MEVALVVLVVLVVMLGVALIRSQRRASHREPPHRAVEAGDVGTELTAPARPEGARSADTASKLRESFCSRTGRGASSSPSSSIRASRRSGVALTRSSRTSPPRSLSTKSSTPFP